MTIARPYARAAFANAKSSDSVGIWENAFGVLECILADPDAKLILENPKRLDAERVEFLEGICRNYLQGHYENISSDLHNFLVLVVGEKRLLALPDMVKHFKELVRQQNNSLDVEVVSVVDFTSDQKERLKKSLDKRLDSDVVMSYRLDKSLIGGAIIRSDNWIMDGSVKAVLERMAKQFD